MDHLLRATAAAEARHFWFRGFRAFVTPLLRHAAANRSRGGMARLLDCGCGTGGNLALLNQFGRAYGFDLSETGVRIGRQAGRTLVVRARVDAAPFPSGSFDVVTSFDVLYSLDDRTERAAAAEMFRLLTPGGWAIVNVAAMEILRGDHSVLSHEVRRYNRDDLRRCLTGAGFAIERITYTNASLFLPMLLARTLQRRRGLREEHEAQQEIGVPPAPVNELLTALLWTESLYLRHFNAPVGSSLLCLARKPVPRTVSPAAAVRI
ncbi:MAG TPA: class I SAM-dependent methyltransferase [Vicinamibacterales bacterium]|nr:class I SAM-dependent methyltransferase [Vicinamibacterales bacterium]